MTIATVRDGGAIRASVCNLHTLFSLVFIPTCRFPQTCSTLYAFSVLLFQDLCACLILYFLFRLPSAVKAFQAVEPGKGTTTGLFQPLSPPCERRR